MKWSPWAQSVRSRARTVLFGQESSCRAQLVGSEDVVLTVSNNLVGSPEWFFFFFQMEQQTLAPVDLK